MPYKIGNIPPNKKIRICVGCNSDFETHPGYGRRGTKRKYCTFRCYVKHAVGKKKPLGFGENNKGIRNNKWKGGISRAYKTGYYSQKYKDWRVSVFLRDNFTCQDCGKIGGYLTAHHVKSFSKYPELRFDIDNGKTLCEPCHAKTDNYKHKAKLEVRK